MLRDSTLGTRPPDAPSLLIEVGWVLAGRLDAVDVRAIHAAQTKMLAFLQERFPDFTWRMPLVHRREFDRYSPMEPVRLLDLGVVERDARHWDYALVVTGADLKSYYKPFALGAPSHAINVAALSTFRIDPAAASDVVEEPERLEVMARRILALGLHLFGHLNDLPHAKADDVTDLMYEPKAVADLDQMEAYSEAALTTLKHELRDVADVRLEETGSYRGKEVLFYLRAMWHGKRDILAAVGEAHPWQFPFRFSRLTTAAASTMTILVITAEAWDLGMTQPPGRILGLSLVALLGTSLYIVWRQQLLLRLRRRRLGEQHVVSNVSICVAVFLGMLTMYALLFATTLVLAFTFFGSHLVQAWAASVEGAITLGNYLALGGFVASLGIIIGALGASFEEQGYFRHVAFVNEET